MKIIHFDVGKGQVHYVQRLDHIHTNLTVNEYIRDNGVFQANIVTCFPTSKFDKILLMQ
jgi:hypothetical protein